MKIREKKVITFKLDNSIIIRFRELCKKHKITQVAVIENAMKKAIEELEERENGNEKQ